MKKQYKKYRISKEIMVPVEDKFDINELLIKIDDLMDVYDIPITQYNFLELYKIESEGHDYFEEDIDGTDENDFNEYGRWIDEEEFDNQGKAIISIGYDDGNFDYQMDGFKILIQVIVDKKDAKEFQDDFNMFAEKHYSILKHEYKIEEIK